MPVYSQKEEFEIKSKSFSFAVLIFLTGFLFLLLVARLFVLQIHQGESFRHHSQMNRFKKRFLRSPRGLILDRNNQILVGNNLVKNLKLNLNSIDNKKEVIKKISQIIGIPEQSINKIIKKRIKKFGSYHPITIKQSLNLNEIHKLKFLHWDYPGVYVEETSQRIYPINDNGSQFLGYTGEVSKTEIKNLKSANKFVHPLDVIGKQGIEKIYDSHLKGVNGWAYLEVDALNRISPIEKSSSFIYPKQGGDITLTIDKDLQKFVYKAMQRKDSIGLRTGSVIVMKTNGEILALLSLPTFNPNIFSSEIDQQDWSQLTKTDSKLFIDKSFQEHYSPGSTLKPFIAIAALSESIISQDTKIKSPNRLKFGNRYFHDHSIFGYGSINVITAIEKSANTFFYQVGNQLGIDRIEKYLRLFGFGQKTKIDVSGEIKGLVPSQAWKQKNLNEAWQLGDTINSSIGQGFTLTTLLQLTVAYNAIATEGLLVKPFIVKKISNKIIQTAPLDTLTDRIDRKHFKTVKEGLRRVTEGSGGTARFWKSSTTSYGGKTGTAQVISLTASDLYKKCHLSPKKFRHHGFFIGLAPIVKTEIVVSVFTENSCSGSSGSAPIARDIIDYYLSSKKYKDAK